VRIGLALKGIPYEYVAVDLARDGGEQFGNAYRALNPQSRVPVLEVDGRPIVQSMAILEWLEEAFPQVPLLPADLYARARVRSLAQIVVSDIQPLQNLSVARYLREVIGAGETVVNVWTAEWITRGMAALESRLTVESGTGRFCHGDAPTLADVCLVPQCHAARRFGVDPARFPVIARIEASCSGLDAFRAAAAERQPDAPR
jgi:maleylacetoacetate isomerase